MSDDRGRETEAATAVELWSRRVSESRDRVAFQYKEGGAWQAVTWEAADAYAREIAAGLMEAGVQAGERVCLLAQTRFEWAMCDVGLLFAGAVVVPIYASNTAEQCAFIIRDSGAVAIVVEDAAQLEKVLSIRGETPSLKWIVYIAGDATLERPDARGRKEVRLADVLPAGAGAAGAGVRSLAEVRASGKAARARLDAESARRAGVVAKDGMFTIIYTSGTTGTPKGVVLSHGNLTSAMASACRAMTLFADDIQLLFLPLAHVLGRELFWVAVQAGLATWFAESIGKLKDNLAEVRPTYMAGVPRVYEKFYGGVQASMAKTTGVKKKLVTWALAVGRQVTAAMGRPLGLGLGLKRWIADRLVFSKVRRTLGLDRCRFLISGGAPLAGEIAEFFYGLGIMILDGYGLTETMAAAFLNPLERPKFGTAGKAFDVVEAKLADDGEVLMRGPSVFRSYYNNAAATAEVVEPDGWFHSGDIGQFEDGGYLRITDRKKDLIVTAGGKKVAPQPIENAIKARTPLVSQAVVYGDRRPYCVALVTPSEDAVKRFANGAGGTNIGESAELRAAIDSEIKVVNAGLAPYETIKTFAILAHDFSEAAGEMTPSMKVKRKVVLEKYRDVIESLYKHPVAASE